MECAAYGHGTRCFHRTDMGTRDDNGFAEPVRAATQGRDRHVEMDPLLRGSILRIRPFIPNDIPAIASIVREALRESYPTSLYFDIHRWWREGFLVAELDGHPVGFLAAVISADSQARILMFAVTTGFRRRGIGSLLMDTFTQHCQQRGIRRIELEVRKSNAEGIRFYGKYGYGIAFTLPSFYTDGEDGYKMIKDFGPGAPT